jgi:anaerobic selenocysteine-containing dehydrogenase
LIAYGHLYIAWNEPAAPAPGECVAAGEICRRLARKLGLTHPALYESEEEIARQLLGSGHPHLRGISFEELKARGWMRLNVPRPFLPFAHGFPTASGRLEFVSERMAKAGLDPLAGFTPPAETSRADTEHPFSLITPANHWFLNTIFANVEEQRQRAGRTTLLIHPDDAAALGIGGGEEVRVGNARGSFLATAEVSDRVRPGVVATPKGRWPSFSPGGTTANATVDERDSDMGGAVFHDNRVRVDR